MHIDFWKSTSSVATSTDSEDMKDNASHYMYTVCRNLISSLNETIPKQFIAAKTIKNNSAPKK